MDDTMKHTKQGEREIPVRFLTICAALLTFLALNTPLYAAETVSLPADLRERCVAALGEALNSDDGFWVNIHAAEALITHVHTEGVRERVSELARKPGSNPIGIARVMARLDRKDPVAFQSHVDTILDIFRNGPEDERTRALESLGKLGFGSALPEIEAAARGDSTSRAMARWILANGGGAEEEASLAGLLASGVPRDWFHASYALRFFDTISDETRQALDRLAERLPPGTPRRVYALSARFVHAAPENEAAAKRDLLAYIDGEENQRYEVCEALAERGTFDDVPLLAGLLDDPSTDVRTAAANALLRIERRAFRGVGALDWVVIVLYGAAMLGIGVFFSRRQKTSDDYLVGGRRVNPFVSGISLFASYISTISYLAIAGETIKHGPHVYVIHVLSIVVVYPLTAWFIIPLFMKLPITSAYEIIEKPLGRGVRVTGSIIFLMTRFIWMGLLIFLTAKALVVMLDWDERFILHIAAVGGIITVAYSTMGGLSAVVTTDVTQFFILIFGAVLTIVLVTVRLGGAGAWIPTEWASNWDDIVWFSWDPHVRLTIFFTIVHIIAWWISTAGSDQMAIQRFISTKNVKTARRAFLWAQLGEKLLFTILMGVGFALLSFYRTNPHFIPDGKDLITDADFLFPNFIANYLPVGASGLVIAAIFAAAMSSLSSGINSTAAVFTSDILPWITRKTYPDGRKLRLAKITSFCTGILVVFLSTYIGKVPGNIMEMTSKTNGLFVCPLFNLFFMALFVPFATPFGTIMGSIYGVVCAWLIAFWDMLTGQPGLTFLWIGPGSLVVSIGFSLLFSLIPSKGKGPRYNALLTIAALAPPVMVIAWVASL